MDIGQILENALLNPDPQKRSEAEAQLSQAASENFVLYVRFLTQTLADNAAKSEVRMLASLQLKNELTSKDQKKKRDQAQRWIALDIDSKKHIKESSLSTLLNSEERVGRSTAQLVAAIADIELPRSEWPELIPIIVESTKTEKPVTVKKAALLTIGYICETSDPNNSGIVSQANGILLAIVQGAQPSEPSIPVRLTAINALVNSLEFIRYNFQREGERNYIMQVVCEATQAEDSDLKASAFGALARIMNLYYSYMSLYMEKALYSLTVAGMQSEDEKVSCMAIEFWSTVCEEELEITLRKQEYGDQLLSESQELVLYNFALGAIKDVLPTLLALLTKQNEDLEDDTWSVAMAAGACLQLYAQNVGNYVVQPTLQFVENNIGSPNWRNREAAIMAFGSILDGPDQAQLKGLIGEALQPILLLMKDDNLQVKDTVAWCLGRIADLVVEAVSGGEYLNNVINAIVEGLRDHAKVSTNCCWTLINLVEQLSEDGENQDTTPLSAYYEVLVPLLIQLSSKSDNDFSSRASAYEALSTLVLYSAKDTMQFVNNIASEVLNRLEYTINLQSQVQSAEDKANLEELQTNILSLLTNVIRRAKKEVVSVSDSLMETFLKLLASQQQQQGQKSLIEEDIFIAIGAIASSIDQDFDKYMQTFLPFLSKALQDTESTTCNTAIGLVADIARSLQVGIVPYTGGLMNILGNHLSNPDIRRELRPPIISCFGDIASSIGENFLPYLDVVMKMLAAAQNLQPEDASLESLDYILNIRESVLDAYVGVVAGLHDNPDALFPHIQTIFQFLSTIPADINFTSSDSVCGSTVGLIGDLAQIYGDKIKPLLAQDWILEFIKHVKNQPVFSQNTRFTAKWAKKLITSK